MYTEFGRYFLLNQASNISRTSCIMIDLMIEVMNKNKILLRKTLVVEHKLNNRLIKVVNRTLHILIVVKG